MICQACRKRLPFKLDGRDQLLWCGFSLCANLGHITIRTIWRSAPNHAAMFLYTNGSRDQLKGMIIQASENELEIILAQQPTQISFTKTHLSDLRALIATEDEHGRQRRRRQRMNRPLRHISIRVPWHDTGWDGHVCAAPRLNGACLNLRRIAESRKDDAEEKIAGKTLGGGFLTIRGGRRAFQNAWASWLPLSTRGFQIIPPTIAVLKQAHGHFKDTPLRHPPYSAPAVPIYLDAAGKT